METLWEMVLKARDRIIGLDPSDVAVDCCIQRRLRVAASRRPVDRGKGHVKRSVLVDANGILLGTVAAPVNRHDSLLLYETVDPVEVIGALPEWMNVHLDRGYDSRRTPVRS